MPGPWWGPAAIGAGGSILGGLVGSGSEANQHKGKEREILAANIKTAKLGHTPIQWVVNDAKKAGIHPLYALGNAGGQGSMAPLPAGGQSRSGSALGEGIRQASSIVSGSLERAQIRALDAQAQKSQAEAQLAASNAKRAEGAANYSQDGNLFAASQIPGPVMPSGHRLPAGMSSPARAFEDRYGEGADVFGYMNMASDYRKLQRKRAAQERKRIGHYNPARKRTKYLTKEQSKKIMKARGWAPTLKRWRDRQHFWPKGWFD